MTMADHFDFPDVAEAVNALIRAGVTPRNLLQICESRATAFRVALSLFDTENDVLDSTPFEVKDVPVYLTEWARECVDRQGYCWITICSGTADPFEKWYVDLLIDEPTFGDDDNRADEASVLCLAMSDEAKSEFDRILSHDFKDSVEVSIQQPVVGQPAHIQVIKFVSIS